MESNTDAMKTLDAAIEFLKHVPVRSQEAEGRALATLIENFRTRLVGEMPMKAEAEMAPPGRRASGYHVKNWTQAELARIGLRVPFSPEVFISRRDRKKIFHTGTCVSARDGESRDLEDLIRDGYHPCPDCGGVVADLSPVQLANRLEEILRYVSDIHRFAQEDFTGNVSMFEASCILNMPYDKLEDECRREAKEKLKGIKEDRYFQLWDEINVLRLVPEKGCRGYVFTFRREDCVGYARRHGAAGFG